MSSIADDRWGRAVAFIRRPEAIACALVVLGILVAAIRAIATHSLPIGDNALFVIRSRDVFSTAHFPLLGTASSASIGAGTGLNHPGPLLFDLLAIPVSLFGATAGIAIGVSLVNICSVIGVSIIGYRIRGRVGSLLATAAAAVATWTLGSAILVEPWNPHVLILPCLLMLIAAAGVAGGDITLVPVLIVVASLCMQTHLSYFILVPVICAAAVAGAFLVWRRRLARSGDDRGAVVRRLRKTAVVGCVTLIVLWLQPLWDLISNGRDGNLYKLLTNDNGDEPTIGARLGLRLITSVIGLPSGWGRTAFITAIPDTGYEPDGITVRPESVAGLAVSIGILVLVCVALFALARRSWNRNDFRAVAVAGMFGVALAACVITFIVMPFGPLGLRPHQMRWLWALGPFMLFAASVNLADDLAADPEAHIEANPRRIRVAQPVLLTAIAVLAMLNLPAYTQGAGPNSETAAIPVAVDLSDQVETADIAGDVVFDPTGSRFAEPYSPAVLAALHDNGQSWFVTDEYLIRQFGESRRSRGDEELRLTVVEGIAALLPPSDTERIAFVTPLSAIEVDDLLQGEQELIASIEQTGVLLTPEGESLVSSGRYLVSLDTLIDAPANASFLVESGTVAQLVADDALLIPDGLVPLYEGVTALRRRVGTDTVAVFVSPRAAIESQ